MYIKNIVNELTDQIIEGF